MEYEFLYHHGIKGQKWGIRKYQNPDGSLTPAGRKRYSKTSGLTRSISDGIKKRFSKSSKPNFDNNEEKETVEQKKARILRSRSAKELYENADLFTTQELQTAYTRLSLERNIYNLSPKDVNKGKQFMEDTVKTAKTVNDMLETGTKLYNNVAKVYNSITEDGQDNPLPLIDKGEKKKKQNDDDED